MTGLQVPAVPDSDPYAAAAASAAAARPQRDRASTATTWPWSSARAGRRPPRRCPRAGGHRDRGPGGRSGRVPAADRGRPRRGGPVDGRRRRLRRAGVRRPGAPVRGPPARRGRARRPHRGRGRLPGGGADQRGGRDRGGLPGRPAGAGPRPPQPDRPLPAGRAGPPAGYPSRFTDLTDLYSARLRALARRGRPGLAEGVYAAMPGPHYETPAEIRMLRTLGADLVGMSTVLEAIAARHLGAEVLAISLVTNPAAGLAATGLDHAEVVAARAGRRGPDGHPAGPGAPRTTDPGEPAPWTRPARSRRPIWSSGCGPGSPTIPTPADQAELQDLLDAASRDDPAGRAAAASLADRFAGQLEFGTAGLRGAMGAGPEPDEPGRGPGRDRRAGRLAARAPARRGPGRGGNRLGRPAPLGGVRCGRRRRAHRGGDPGAPAARPQPHAAAGVRGPAPGRRGRRDDHGQPQPACRQRLQALPGRRRADRAAGGRPDRGGDPRPSGPLPRSRSGRPGTR